MFFFNSATLRLVLQSNSAVDVLLYASRLSEYRAAIRRIIWFLLPWKAKNAVHPFFVQQSSIITTPSYAL